MKKIELQFAMPSIRELQSRRVFRTLLDQALYENTLNA